MFLPALILTAALGGSAQPQGRQTVLPVIDVARLPEGAAEAIGQAYAAARADPRNAEGVGRLAITLHAWEQWDPASEAYRRARELAPGDRRWSYLAGLLEVARGRHGDALPLLERAAALAPEDPAGRLRVAEAKLETGDLGGSQSLLVELAREPRTAVPAQYGLGRVAMARGDFPAAIGHFERAVAGYPDFGAAHYALALAYRRMGRTADAGKALARQQKCLPCWPAVEDQVAALVPAARGDGAAILKRGIQLAAQGDVAGAIAAHEEALALSPSLAQARLNLITLYGRAARWSEAEARFREAVTTGRNLSEARANYAQVLLGQRRAAESIPLFREALDANPIDAASLNGLGLAMEMTGDHAGALGAYRQAVESAPTFRAARFNYGRLLVLAGRLDEAIGQFERLREPEDEETPRYLFALSAARVRSGDVESGRAQAAAALTLARRYGQQELASTIERDLAALK